MLTQSIFSKYSDGKRLYGDDFSEEEIEQWFRDEEEGYYNLLPERKAGRYGYYALNWYHGFRHIPQSRFEHVLGVGSAFGDELQPVLDRSAKITVLEPSGGFQNPRFEYVKPHVSGQMPFADETFDLLTCFGVLHHIPNVSTVVREFGRCMKPGGWCLIREPIVSMGNWEQPRRGLTPRERGIPYSLMKEIVRNAGFEIAYRKRCMFSLTPRVCSLLPLRVPPYNSRFITIADSIICSLPFWSRPYHPRNLVQRFCAGSAFFVLRKPGKP